MYGLIFAFDVPLTLWVFAFRGPMAAFWGDRRYSVSNHTGSVIVGSPL